ncbi:MAG: MCE family protein [Deltaproteobacteria bacterium]|nr:MCE family protein [Deltaproteobacteria bacterium]
MGAAAAADEGRLARRVGAGILVFALAAAVLTMLLSGVTLAPGFILHVDFERIANLKPGAKVMMCGRQVGEIVAVRLAPKGTFLQKKRQAADEPEEARLTLDLWLRWRYQRYIHRNSEFFVNSAGLLGDQYLEVGAPRGEPGPTVKWGEHIRGIDPPRLDRLLQKTYGSLQVVTTVIRELKPFTAEITAAVQHLTEIQREAGIDGARLDETRARIEATINEGQAAWAALQQGTHRGADLRALQEELGRLGDRLGDDLRLLGRKLDLLMARLEGAKDIWSPERRARITRAFATLRRVVDLAEKIARDGRAIVAMVERGEGNVGAFSQDQELWDDFHYVHKVLKDRPWSLIVKPRRPVRE